MHPSKFYFAKKRSFKLTYFFSTSYEMWRKRYFTLAIEIDKLFFCLKIAKKCNKKSFRTPTQWRRFENWLSIVNEVRIILQQPYWSRNRFLCNCCHIKSKWKRNIIYYFFYLEPKWHLYYCEWFIKIQKYRNAKIYITCMHFWTTPKKI